MPRICAINGPGAVHTQDGSTVKFDFVANLNAGVRHIKRLIGDTPINLPDDAAIGMQVVAAHAVPSDEDLIDPAMLERAAALLKRKIEGVLGRYSAAYTRDEPVTPHPHDAAVLALNALAWKARRRGAFWDMFPDEPSGWRFDPIDPSLLQCEVPIERKTLWIERALVRGVYEADDRQGDLFNPWERRDIIIVLSHDHPQVRYIATLAEAQAIWRGVVRISARIEIEGDSMPVVVGPIVLEREDLLGDAEKR